MRSFFVVMVNRSFMKCGKTHQRGRYSKGVATLIRKSFDLYYYDLCPIMDDSFTL